MDPREFYKLVREMSVAADDETITLYDSFDLELSEDFVIETGVVGFTQDGVIVEADESTLEFLELNDVLLEDEKLDEKMIMGASSDASAAGSKTLGEVDEVKSSPYDAGYDAAYNNTDETNPYPEHTEENEEWEKGFARGSDDAGIEDKAHMATDQMRYGEVDELDELKKLAFGRNVDEAKYQGRTVSLGKPFLTPDGPKKRSVYVKKPNGKVVKVNFGDKKMRIKKSNPARRKSFRARHNCSNPGPRWKARYWSCKFW